ncbi:hypothetical protein UlMin_035848 [Ulmus minor]
MKLTEFVGSTDPLEAEEWISSIETILDFMQLNDQERVACASFMLKKGARHWWTTVKLTRNVEAMTWANFLREFEHKYYNSAILRAQQDEFLNLKQGSMTVVEAVNKFEQLSRLCPFMVRTEEERLRHMMVMFRKDIALVIESGGSPPTTVAKCVERAIRIEYRMAQLKEERTQNFEARRNQRKEGAEGQNKNSNRGFKPNYRANQSANFKKKGKPSGQGSRNNQPQRKNSQNYPVCKKCGRTHPRECRAGNPNVCYRSQIYAYTKGDVEAGTSNVVTGQLSVSNLTLHVLFDSGATHSFISIVQANRIDRVKEVIARTFRTSLPSGDVLVSTHWLRAIPIQMSDRELYVDLIILNMYDYDVILGMDFLSKYNATIECRYQRVTFKPSDNDEFSYLGEDQRKQKMIISSMKARRMLLSGCQ